MALVREYDHSFRKERKQECKEQGSSYLLRSLQKWNSATILITYKLHMVVYIDESNDIF